MKTLQTKYGGICLDEIEDRKFITTIEQGYYPNDDVIEALLGYVDKSSVVADIGANVGTVAIPLSKFVQEVHCFEPIPRNIELLKKNIELNALMNVFVHPCALGDTEEILSFFEEDTGNAGTYRWGKEGLSVAVRTLDSFNLPINAMKIDVQGMESKVLGGADHTIERFAPVIFFELSGRNLEIKGAFSTMHHILRSYNFYISMKNSYGKILSLWLTTLLKLPGVVLLGKKGHHFDIMALPKSGTLSHYNSFSTFLFLIWQLAARAATASISIAARQSGKYLNV